MTSLSQLIQISLNPFDPATFRPGNFWQEQQNPALEVSSIHQTVLRNVDRTLDQVAADRITRTLLLVGESGAGKSHLLGRIKHQLNPKAFFAYIGPWPDSAYLWRHTLRNTVDSLMHIPVGQSESQLLLWLRSLPSLRDRSLVKWMVGERNTFIRDLRASFPAGIYNSKEFFGVLYDLATNPDLRPIACDWLKGDDLDQDDLKALRVKQSLESEDAAQKVLLNIGRIAAVTQPIVLCFDNLDNIPALADGKVDLQSLFSLNSTLHNEKLSQFLVLISVITSTWVHNRGSVQPADVARINQTLSLKPITLDQAEALWASRLAALHSQVSPSPNGAIVPLSRGWLNHKFPRGKALPRNVLMLGQQLIAYYKEHQQLPALPTAQPGSPPKARANGAVEAAPAQNMAIQNAEAVAPSPSLQVRGTTSPGAVQGQSRVLSSPPPKTDSSPSVKQPRRKAAKSSPAAQAELHQDVELASFHLLWEKEFQTARHQVTRVGQLTSPELIWRLRQVLEALEIKVKASFLKGSKFAAYSISHQQPVPSGLVWCEDRNMTTFYHVMNACQKVVDRAVCDRLLLIRSEGVGRQGNRGHEIYQHIFNDQPAHQHLKPDLLSVQYLETYHHLVNAACGGELVVGQKTPNLKQLQALIRAAQVLDACPLLQELKLVDQAKVPASSTSPTAAADVARTYMINLVTTQQFMGLELLVKNTQAQVDSMGEADIEQIIQQLCREGRLQLLDAGASRASQLVCLVPS
ncbi:MAG: ATP-binding protein [Leptolyngbya sp. DLM2.Bin27]|nr:MAG: ATP-binding protein [Leptolyngbya sp. DLM2.Bin27]